MDYVFGGQWSDDLRSRVHSWIDRKWATWGEESPGHELADFIQELLGQAKTMAEVANAFMDLALSEERAKELALELGELLRSYQSAATAASAETPATEAVKTVETVSGPSMKKPAMEPVARREHFNVSSSLTSSRDDRDQQHVQDTPRGKRQMDSEEEQGNHQQHNESVRNVRARQQEQSSSSATPIADTLRHMEELNRVAVQSGFQNPHQMLEMVYSGGAAPMMPPVAAYPPAPYNVPFLSDHAAYLLAKSAMAPEILRYGAAQGLEFTEAFLRTVRTAAGRGHPVPESDD
eukprot:gene10016-7160_t